MSEEPQLPWSERYKLIKLGKLPKEVVAKKKKPLRRVSLAKLAENQAAKEVGGDGKSDLVKWYEKIMQNEPGKCWETGERINKQDKLGWHGSVAHILCKKNFPSVATHPQNYMILSMWNGAHSNYDSSWERAASMKVWPYALKIIITVLLPLLTPEEKRHIPEVVIQEIDPLKK